MHQVESERELSESVGKVVYTTTENHLDYCTFLMRRIHRALQNQARLTARVNLSHTEHCTALILKAIGANGSTDGAEIASGSMVGTASCLTT